MSIDNKLFVLKAENSTLLQVMQLHLSADELAKLNAALYDFASQRIKAGICPEFKQLVEGVKCTFKQ